MTESVPGQAQENNSTLDMVIQDIVNEVNNNPDDAGVLMTAYRSLMNKKGIGEDDVASLIEAEHMDEPLDREKTAERRRGYDASFAAFSKEAEALQPEFYPNTNPELTLNIFRKVLASPDLSQYARQQVEKQMQREEERFTSRKAKEQQGTPKPEGHFTAPQMKSFEDGSAGIYEEESPVRQFFTKYFGSKP
ncbi:MAG: hypothetical protein WC761_06305 [Candidatus Paceibacterota bacterium]|jgi:hypothetical protein